MPSITTTQIDLRTIAARDRHALVFDGFDALTAGQALELVNNHGPVPLRDQFERRSPGSFAWRTLEAGPVLWRVRIAKMQVALPVAADSCCSGGACCG